jgi:hypothetical protein
MDRLPSDPLKHRLVCLIKSERERDGIQRRQKMNQKEGAEQTDFDHC